MSSGRESADDGHDADGLDATTKNHLIDLAEDLSAVDGPLVGDGDRERAEDIVGRMHDALDLPRAASVDDELQIEAAGDDTLWRKQTTASTARTECGPFYATEEAAEIEESHFEVMPHGLSESVVNVDVQLSGDYQGVDYQQGSIHELTPEQARSFAAALLEQAAAVENQQTEP